MAAGTEGAIGACEGGCVGTLSDASIRSLQEKQAHTYWRRGEAGDTSDPHHDADLGTLTSDEMSHMQLPKRHVVGYTRQGLSRFAIPTSALLASVFVK